MPPRWPAFNEPCDLRLYCDRELARATEKRLDAGSLGVLLSVERDEQHSILLPAGALSRWEEKPCPAAGCDGTVRVRPPGEAPSRPVEFNPVPPSAATPAPKKRGGGRRRAAKGDVDG